ncbi:MAG: efflux RND transporter periplasmic adaptor subunit [Akkermansiaceae bacterium]
MKLKHKLYQALFLSILATFFVSCNAEKDKSTGGGKDFSQAAEVESSEGSEVEVHAKADCPAGDGCFICDKSKREAGRLWCKEHDRYENRCFLCHPELKEEGRLFCTEHGIYEDECYICHPEIKKTGASTAPESSPTSVLMCKEHNVFEHECAICQPDLASGLKPGESLKIRVASAEAMPQVGIEVSKPGSSTGSVNIDAYCTVNYNQNKVAKITPLAAGIVQEIEVVPGQVANAGSVLGIIHSPDLAEMKSKFLAAIAGEKLAKLKAIREQKLAKDQISARADLEAAEAAWDVAIVEVSAARQRLINLGLNQSDIDSVINGGRPDSLLTLKAPFTGTIVKRDVSVGEMVTPGDSIFVIADLSTMWLELSIPVREAAGLKIGMPVSAFFDDIPDTLITGELIWIASAIDPKTRRIQARAIVLDPPTVLRKGLYGTAKIETKKPKISLTVPTGSIQMIDDRPFVFVRQEPDLFAATRVELSSAHTDADLTAITSGLNENDMIVSRGSYIMRSEFLKSLLGAGCVDD